MTCIYYSKAAAGLHYSVGGASGVGARRGGRFVSEGEVNLIQCDSTAWPRFAAIKFHCNLCGRCPMHICIRDAADFHTRSLQEYTFNFKFGQVLINVTENIYIYYIYT